MKTVSFFAVILFVFTACSQSSSNETKVPHNSEVKDQTQTIQRVSNADFKDYMANNKDYILVDIRTPKEFDEGTISGAININSSSRSFKEELNKLDKSRPVLMFCQSGGRSGRALPVFKSLGFEFVLELQGGYGGY
ncbi:MAG: rhodanese-like domain-containing protein [Crocinitomicaceae bacterium]